MHVRNAAAYEQTAAVQLGDQAKIAVYLKHISTSTVQIKVLSLLCGMLLQFSKAIYHAYGMLRTSSAVSSSLAGFDILGGHIRLHKMMMAVANM